MPDKKRNDDAAAKGRDRRTSTRYRTRALTDGSFTKDAGEVPAGGHSFLGTTVNVSAGGVLVRTYEALTAGQEVSLKMHLPEGDLRVIGTVLHVEQDAVGCRLAGVRFATLASDQFDLLNRHLKTFDPRREPRDSKGARSKRADVKTDVVTPYEWLDESPAPKARSAAPVEDVAKGDASRKSISEMRHREAVVWPFEGQIHRE